MASLAGMPTSASWPSPASRCAAASTASTCSSPDPPERFWSGSPGAPAICGSAGRPVSRRGFTLEAAPASLPSTTRDSGPSAGRSGADRRASQRQPIATEWRSVAEPAGSRSPTTDSDPSRTRRRLGVACENRRRARCHQEGSRMARMHSLTRRSVLALLCTAGVFLWLPTTALAADLRQGANVTVGAGQTVSDDIYAAGGTITVAGTINGSLIAAGATITVSGNVSRDLIIAGGTINVTGKVGGSIRAAGGNLTLNGPVEQDVVITGGMIAIGSGATIGRDLVLAGGTTTVAAPVTRRVMMASGSLTLMNRVGGDVRGNVDHLKLDGAQIGGNLDYTSNNQVEIVNGARIAGTTSRPTPPDRGASGPTNSFIGWLRALLGIVALW